MAVLHHSFHVQVLDKDLRVVFADLGRELVKEISAHIGNAPVTTRQKRLSGDCENLAACGNGRGRGGAAFASPSRAASEPPPSARWITRPRWSAPGRCLVLPRSAGGLPFQGSPPPWR